MPDKIAAAPGTDEKTKETNNKLDRDFSLLALARFTVPSILNLIMISITVMVDSLFVANIVGENGLAAMNLVYPLTTVVMAFGYIFGVGGSAIIGKNMGQNRYKTANQRFTMLLLAAVVLGVIIAVGTTLALPILLPFLGASDLTGGYMAEYLRIYVAFAPAIIAQIYFYYAMIAAGKPGLNMSISIVSGTTNIVLDYLLMVVWDYGVAGAAWGTTLSTSASVIISLTYFTFNRRAPLRFARPVYEWRVLRRAVINGLSEAVYSFSGSINNWIFNMVALAHAGESGVAALALILYLQFLLIGSVYGYISGIAPAFSFNLGAKNWARNRRLLRQSAGIMFGLSSIAFIAAQLFPGAMVTAFVKPGTPAFELGVSGLRVFAFSFLFAWLAELGSAVFTALNNGVISGVIAFGRAIVFVLPLVALLPLWMGIDGLWLAIVGAEILAAGLAIFFIWRTRERYHLLARN